MPSQDTDEADQQIGRRSPRDISEQAPTREKTATNADVQQQSNEDGTSNDGDEYLVAVSYQSDAERKRVEYLFNNYDDIEAEKIEGFARIVTTDDFEPFYEALSSKVDRIENVQANALKKVGSEPKEHTEQFTVTTDADPDRIEWAFEMIKDRRGATVEDPEYNQFVANTRKGTARYAYSVIKNNDLSEVTVEVWGYGEAPSVLREFIEEELEHAI